MNEKKRRKGDWEKKKNTSMVKGPMEVSRVTSGGPPSSLPHIFPSASSSLLGGRIYYLFLGHICPTTGIPRWRGKLDVIFHAFSSFVFISYRHFFSEKLKGF